MKKRICIILIVLISALLLAGCEKTKKGPPGWSTQSTQKDKSGDEAKNTSETQPGTEAAPTGTEPGEDPQKRGFAAAGGAQQKEEFSGVDVQINAPENGHT